MATSAVLAPLARAIDTGVRPEGAPAKVDTPSAAWIEMESRWRLPHALVGGTKRMRELATAYLPQFPDETDEAYEVRRKQSFLLNGYRNTLAALSRMPFTRPVVVGEGTPAALRDLAQRADPDGRSLTELATDLLWWAIHEGLAHVLVDFPPAPADRPRTAADRDRPVLQLLPASQVIGWRTESRAGEERVTQLRIYETALEPEGEFGERAVERVRVLRDTASEVTFEVFERDTGERTAEWRSVEGPTPIRGVRRIPISTLYTCRTAFFQGMPALEDLAWANLAHWQSASDQRSLLHIARAGILFGSGIDPEEVGARPSLGGRGWFAKSPDADLKWVEHTGQAIAAGRADLGDLEDQMLALGLRPLIAQPRVTATAAAIESAQTHAGLVSWVRNAERTLETAIGRDAAAFLGIRRREAAGTEIDIHEGFDVTANEAAELDALLKLRQAREITRETLLSELRRRRMLPEGFDIASEISALEAEAQTEGPMTSGMTEAA